MRLELAKEDTRLVAHGEISAHKISLTSFIVTGLDLEEHQYVSLISIYNLPVANNNLGGHSCTKSKL